MSKDNILLQEYNELRDELKQRIEQRDNLCTQCIGFIGVLITAAITVNNAYIGILIPVVCMFYAMQIFESYRVHERLVEFIRENIEKTLAEELKCEQDDFFWESYCRHERDLTLSYQNIGGRKTLFKAALLVVPFFPIIMAYVMGQESYIFAAWAIICELMGIFYLWKDKSKLSYTGLNKLAFCDYLRKADRTDEPTKAVFFDKDGTLHEDRVMTHRIRDLVILPGAKEAIKKYHDMGYLIIVVTNQSAIGKGIYSIRTMHRFISIMRFRLKYIDAVYYCPHKAGVKCICRKPNTGMFERAHKELNVDLSQSIMVGDRMSDIEAGVNAGVGRNVLVSSGLYVDEKDNEIIYEQIDSLLEL